MKKSANQVFIHNIPGGSRQYADGPGQVNDGIALAHLVGMVRGGQEPVAGASNILQAMGGARRAQTPLDGRCRTRANFVLRCAADCQNRS